MAHKPRTVTLPAAAWLTRHRTGIQAASVVLCWSAAQLLVFDLAWRTRLSASIARSTRWPYLYETPAYWLANAAGALTLLLLLRRVERWRATDFGLTAGPVIHGRVLLTLLSFFTLGSSLSLLFFSADLAALEVDGIGHLPLAMAVAPLAGVGEEFVFRACLQRMFERAHRDWGAVIAAALFALAHLGAGWSMLLVVFPAGVLYALAYQATGHLPTLMLVHAVHDFLWFAGLSTLVFHAPGLRVPVAATVAVVCVATLVVLRATVRTLAGDLRRLMSGLAREWPPQLALAVVTAVIVGAAAVLVRAAPLGVGVDVCLGGLAALGLWAAVRLAGPAPRVCSKS